MEEGKMASNFKLTYNVDMVFCIDCTGSMDNIIDIVKNNALNFYQDVTQAMEVKSKHIDQLRVRVVAFRDYLADGKDAMLVTDFFKLPEQAADFEKCVRSLRADGGGDDPEDGLEALAYAIKSKWDTEGMKKRQVIVVWTDESTHKLGFGTYRPALAAASCTAKGYVTVAVLHEQALFLVGSSYYHLLHTDSSPASSLKRTVISPPEPESSPLSSRRAPTRALRAERSIGPLMTSICSFSSVCSQSGFFPSSSYSSFFSLVLVLTT